MWTSFPTMVFAGRFQQANHAAKVDSMTFPTASLLQCRSGSQPSLSRRRGLERPAAICPRKRYVDEYMRVRRG